MAMVAPISTPIPNPKPIDTSLDPFKTLAATAPQPNVCTNQLNLCPIN